jgi:arginine deiminase
VKFDSEAGKIQKVFLQPIELSSRQGTFNMLQDLLFEGILNLVF